MHSVYWSNPKLTECPRKYRRKLKDKSGWKYYSEQEYPCNARTCKFLGCRMWARKKAYAKMQCKFDGLALVYYARLNAKYADDMSKSCDEIAALLTKMRRWCKGHGKDFKYYLMPEKTKASKVHWQGVVWLQDDEAKETWKRYCSQYYYLRQNNWSLTPINDPDKPYRDLTWAILYTTKQMRQPLIPIVHVRKKKLVLTSR